MPEPRPQAIYTCSQSELYAICTIGWNSYSENQPDFETFKTIYTAAFGTDALAEVDVAMNLPGFQERNEASETFYIQMTEAHAACILKWKALRSYIKSSFEPALQKPKIESAGYDHYAKAANKNWDETTLLMTAGQHFIDNNTAELTTGGMPAAFPTEYADATSEFSGLYDRFTDAEQDQQEATDTKINANNAIYQKLIAMFEDAQIIYETDASKRERFVFAQIKKMISQPGGTDTIPADTTLISGIISDAANSDPIANASVNTTPPGSTETFSAITDSDGVYELKVTDLEPNSSGTLDINAEALDYDPTTAPLAYETGKKQELNIGLSATQEPEPPVDP